MPNGKSSGPDGLPIEFYKAFWPIVREDVVLFVQKCMTNGVSLRCINRAAITLIPKKTNPESMSDYRPISVMNTILKIVTKVMANRVKPHLEKLITLNQMTFIKGRSLMESFLAERIPRIVSKKKPTCGTIQGEF
jgi:hypothetical protein